VPFGGRIRGTPGGRLRGHFGRRLESRLSWNGGTQRGPGGRACICGHDTARPMEPHGPSRTGEPATTDAPVELVDAMRAGPAILGAQDEAGPTRGHYMHCPVYRLRVDGRSQLIAHLRTQRDPEHRAALADSSPVYHELRGLHVMPCPLGCGAVYDGGRSGTSRHYDAHV
jgi:hypothetical protein